MRPRDLRKLADSWTAVKDHHLKLEGNVIQIKPYYNYHYYYYYYYIVLEYGTWSFYVENPARIEIHSWQVQKLWIPSTFPF